MLTFYQLMKQSVAETVPNKASVNTGNATFSLLHFQRNEPLVSVHNVLDQVLRSSVSLSGTV